MKFPDLTLQVLHLDEPLLEFGSRQTTEHPKDGLFLYGPLDKSKKSRDVRIGIIGTPAGINYFRKWTAQIKKMVSVPPPGKTEKKNRLHLANFPGIEETFKVALNDADFVTYPLEPRDIDTATRILNLHEAVSKTVKLYADKARRHMGNDERTVDVWVLVVPEIVSERCRPQANRAGLPKEKGDFGKKQSKRSNLPLLGDLIDKESEDIFDDVPDFHRQVKAEFLTISPTQIVRETTLDPDVFKNKSGQPLRRTQDRATVAWNLTTGLYYKTQPVPPWRLFGIRPGVCYVGLVYKNIPNDPNDHACCAAQMFLSEGDGVVFRGANGPWKTGDFEFHLKPEAAKDLIRKVLTTYIELHGKPPAELFIHGQTSYNDEEWRALRRLPPPKRMLSV